MAKNNFKNIRTGQGDILNELKRRRDVHELGKNETWRAIKKHYAPNVLGSATAMVTVVHPMGKFFRGKMQSSRIAESLNKSFSEPPKINFRKRKPLGKYIYRDKQRTQEKINILNKSFGPPKSTLQKIKDPAIEIGLGVAPELLGAAVGGYGGFKAGRYSHKREKIIADRLKDSDKESLFNSLSDKGKEQYAYHLGKELGTPIIKQLQEKKKKENQAIKEKRLEYRANNQHPIDLGLHKYASSTKPFEVKDSDKINRSQIYDELVIRRNEALGKKTKGLKRRDFKQHLIKELKNPGAMKATGIMGAISGISAYRAYKDGEISKKRAIAIPAVMGPGLHALYAGNAALSNTINNHFNRKKNRFHLMDSSTEELEKRLGRTMLNKLYREHGVEGEEHYE